MIASKFKTIGPELTHRAKTPHTLFQKKHTV